MVGLQITWSQNDNTVITPAQTLLHSDAKPKHQRRRAVVIISLLPNRFVIRSPHSPFGRNGGEKNQKAQQSLQGFQIKAETCQYAPLSKGIPTASTPHCAGYPPDPIARRGDKLARGEGVLRATPGFWLNKPFDASW